MMVVRTSTFYPPFVRPKAPTQHSQIHTRFCLFPLFNLVLAFPIEPRGLNGFKTDLNVLSGKINDLYKKVDSVNNTLPVQQSLDIYFEFQAVKKALDQCDNDVKKIHHLSENDAQGIIAAEKSLVAKTVGTLNTLIREKGAFQPYASVVEEQLMALHMGFMMLTDTLINVAPVCGSSAMSRVVGLTPLNVVRYPPGG
ncbi:hypothetical protein AX15_004176 [Amanita polypyramis BW_CC]|nr:hypothetical protein AX15_004176 [Amanita polypyramis BW_CC]